MATHLMCNLLSCGKQVEEHAWICSCSHVFCDEHGTLEFTSNRPNKCPLCAADLPNRLDIVKTDINPSEQYKSMILAGQRPEAIIEIASRALFFWNYQMQLQFSREKQERMDEERKVQETVARLMQEKNTLEMDLKNAVNDADEQKKRNSDLENVLAEKSRQNLKLTAALDAMRCRLTEQDTRQQQKGSIGNNAGQAGNFNNRLGFLYTNPVPHPQRATPDPAVVSGHFPTSTSHEHVSFGESEMNNQRIQSRQVSREMQGQRSNTSGNVVPSFNLNF